jgi:TrmH family RNA methyltransferase
MDGAVTVRAITSLANDTVKAVRALHLKKARDETGLFLAEGLKIVASAVDLGFSPKLLLHSHEAADHPVLRRVAGVSEEVIEVSAAVLGKISRRDNPQTVLGVFEQRWSTPDMESLVAAECVVGLENVRDPGNLGTIVRTADAAACGAVILIGDCCDPFSVEAVRATMGSIFAAPLIRMARPAFLEWRRAWPGSTVGALLSATTDFRLAPYRRPALVLLGNEQAGLSEALTQVCDLKVKIPMRGRADSLNLAVAAGVMIYGVIAPAERAP